MTTNTVEIVRAAIAANEQPSPVEFGCSNTDLDEATGLDPTEVDDALERLWRADQIEGILTVAGGRNPSLQGIRLVLPGRARAWENDGWYKARP